MKSNITLDTRELKKAIATLKGRFPTVMARVLKRTGTSARAVMVQAIAQDTGLPSTRVRKEIAINLVGQVGVQLQVAGYRIPLIDFQARGPEPSRGRGSGVSYKLGSGGRNRAPHAFIATMRSGHRGVFVRAGRPRLGIRELRGPSMAHVFEKFLPLGAQRAEEALLTNLRSEIKYALSKE